jgi:hypothetical protein
MRGHGWKDMLCMLKRQHEGDGCGPSPAQLNVGLITRQPLSSGQRVDSVTDCDVQRCNVSDHQDFTSVTFVLLLGWFSFKSLEYSNLGNISVVVALV